MDLFHYQLFNHENEIMVLISVKVNYALQNMIVRWRRILGITCFSCMFIII